MPIYFADCNREDLFKVEDIETASDIIVWAVDKRPDNEAIPVTPPQDKRFIGNIVETMHAYTREELGTPPIHLDDVDHLIVIGSDRMMATVKEARHGILEPYLKNIMKPSTPLIHRCGLCKHIVLPCNSIAGKHSNLFATRIHSHRSRLHISTTRSFSTCLH